MPDLIDRKKAIEYFTENIAIVDSDGCIIGDMAEREKIWTERFSGIPTEEESKGSHEKIG